MSHPFSHIPGVSYDPKTNEPFLTLAPPLHNYRLTPWRDDEVDVQSNMEILNDKRVYMNLLGPPYPYTEEMAKSWIKQKHECTSRLVKYLQETKGWSEIQKISACPFEVIRYSENIESAGGRLLGCIDARPESLNVKPGEMWKDPFFPDGDFAGKQQWMFGDFLSPDHHGKGVMSACVAVLLARFFDPIMRVKYWRLGAFVGNWASRRVFEKNGFHFTGETRSCGKRVASKGEPEELFEWVMELRR
ncbi:hypothetical protein BT69DRAFT_18884 [Atractiella rhizophila]|nr:hypothetical protein BT69DRAFT_18884 [Atractiella rhizophila]